MTDLRVFFGLSHVDVEVRSVDRASAALTLACGFSVAQQGAGFCDIETGSGLVRFIETTTVTRTASLRLQVADVVEAHRRLLHAGYRRHYDPERLEAEVVASVLDDDGNVFRVWRPLTEDERDAPVPLPTTRVWTDETTHLLQSLLKQVPALFRGLARRKVTREVEALSEAEGTAIDRRLVVRGFIRSNAPFTRRLRTEGPLRAHGFDPADFKTDYDAG